MNRFPNTGKTLHFIGIAGIGMSGIAEVLSDLGYQVTGSDLQENSNVQRLRAKGVKIFIGHDISQLDEADVAVISSAIKDTNPELIAARARRLPVLRRAEMLAELMRLRKSICVSGTHGKTTTTSLCASLLMTANFDPTVVNGGIINAYNTNARLGRGEWFVAEADESDRSFLKLPPTIAIVTNIDPEHMENYRSFEHVIEAYEEFAHNVPFYGLTILCSDHPVVRDLAVRLTDRRKVTYGLSEGADIQAVDIRTSEDETVFSVHFNTSSPFFHLPSPFEKGWEGLFDLQLPMLGKHNVQNALTLIALAIELNIPEAVLRKALSEFSGVKRRFTKVGTFNDATIIDDYAHHPTEVKAVLSAARQSTSGRIIAVFQPHRFTRLRDLFPDFVTSLEQADIIYITPVYSAGEAPIQGFNEHTLLETLQSVYPSKSIRLVGQVSELAHSLYEIALPKDKILCMGAGTITQWAYQLLDLLNPSTDNKVRASL